MASHSHDPASSIRLPVAPVHRITEPFARFLHVQSASGAVLLAATIAALVLVALHAGWSDRLLAERYAKRIPGTGVPLDPYLRKSEMARAAASCAFSRPLSFSRNKIERLKLAASTLSKSTM